MQKPFKLPAANTDDIYNIFFAKMNEILGDISDNKWVKYYWTYIFTSFLAKCFCNFAYAQRLAMRYWIW